MTTLSSNNRNAQVGRRASGFVQVILRSLFRKESIQAIKRFAAFYLHKAELSNVNLSPEFPLGMPHGAKYIRTSVRSARPIR